MGDSAPTHELWKQTEPRFLAFDSFEGLPPTEGKEKPEEWVEGAYSCSEAQLKRNLEADGVDLKDVTTVRGFYDKTLTPETKQQLGLKWCRSYRPRRLRPV